MIKESSTSSEKRSEKRKRTHRANHPHKSVGALPIEWSWHSVSKCTFLHQPCEEQGFWTLCGRTALTLLPSQRWWAIDYFFVSPPFSILLLLRKYLLINYHHHRNCMHFILNCILHENNLLCSQTCHACPCVQWGYFINFFPQCYSFEKLRQCVNEYSRKGWLLINIVFSAERVSVLN